MYGDAADLGSVSGVVALNLVVDVVEDHHCRDEVDDLAGGQQVQVVATVLAPVAVPREIGDHQVIGHWCVWCGHTPIPV